MCAMREDGAVQPYGPRPSSPASGSIRRAELDRLLEFPVRDTGGARGCGLPAGARRAGAAVGGGRGAAGGISDALVPGGAVQSCSGAGGAASTTAGLTERPFEEFARRHPRTAIALPYHCAAATAPFVTGTRAWGTLLLLWPGSDTAGAAGPGPDRCCRLSPPGGVLRDAADTGHAVRPGQGRRPHIRPGHDLVATARHGPTAWRTLGPTGLSPQLVHAR
jgi:hypothetical protein